MSLHSTGNGTPHAPPSRCEIAIEYIRRGYRPIPIPAREKAPNIKGWTKLRVSETDAAQYFRRPGNIGIILGEASGCLIDIDLDCSEAIEFAQKILPPTEAIFGRKSKPRSHLLYRCKGPAPSLQFRDPCTGDMLLEMRGDGGKQTVFPPSIHPSGEIVTWESDGEPSLCDYSELERAARKLAAECMTKRYLNGSLAALETADERISDQIRSWLGLPRNIISTSKSIADTFASAKILLPPSLSGPLPDYLENIQTKDLHGKVLRSFARSDLNDCVRELRPNFPLSK